MSAFAGGALSLGGSLLGGLFGGDKRTSAYHYFNDLAAHGQSLYGFPLFNQGAQAKYGMPQEQTYPFKARQALDSFMQQGGSLADRFGQQGQQNINQFSGNMGGLADMVGQRGQSMGASLMGSYMGDTAGLGRDAKRIEAEARQWGAGRERQINSDYDAYTRQRAGDLLGSYFNRGLGNSTIATAGLAQLGGETERARQSSLQNAAESSNDRITGAMQYGTNLQAARAAGLPSIYAQQFGMQGAGDPYRMAQYQGQYQGQDSLLTRLLGTRMGLQERQLGMLASPDLINPDPMRWAQLYAGQPQSSSNQFMSSLGSGIAGIGTSLLGNYFGGGGGGQQGNPYAYGPF